MVEIARRRFLIATLAMTAAGTLASRASAQERPLRIIFPFGAGGAADAVLRHLAEALRGPLGRAIVVENVTGAGGRIGLRAARDAAPDGATLVFAAGAQMFLQPHVFANLGYDPLADLVPVCQVMTFDQALVVSAQVPARTLRELADWVRAHPQQATYGSPGAGTGAHFAGVEFARLAGIGMEHAPYRGTPAALPDLVSGRLPVYIASSAELAEHHRAGTIRMLATLQGERSPFTPDIPTFRESGFDVVAPAWFALHAPARTPPAVVQRLEQAVLAALRDPAVDQRIRQAGFLPTGLPGARLATLQRAEFDRWAPIVRASGYRAEP